jgi:hypothetical protein
MRKALPIILLLMAGAAFLGSCSRTNNNPGNFDEQREKEAVWKAVETRFYSWKDNDYDAHMAIYHPEWRRWSLNSRELMKKDDFIGLWEMMKNDEQVVDMTLEPVEIKFYCDGDMAIVHFLSTESYLWTGTSKSDDDGELIERGSVLTTTMRWSDVMVREKGKWLYVGGHRDFGSLEEDE